MRWPYWSSTLPPGSCRSIAGRNDGCWLTPCVTPDIRPSEGNVQSHTAGRMMDIETGLLLNFMVALGIGLLIGAEREHSQPPEESGVAIAGVRTFTIAAL